MTHLPAPPASSGSSLLRRARRRSLLEGVETLVTVDWGRERIESLIPQREPFLLVDRITRVDTAGGWIVGERWMDPADPVFRGHFPNDPVYPGALQLEMAGQLALCLERLGSAAGAPVMVRAVGVEGAAFVGAVRPGDVVTLVAHRVPDEGWLSEAIVQVLVGERVCSASILRVHLAVG